MVAPVVLDNARRQWERFAPDPYRVLRRTTDETRDFAGNRSNTTSADYHHVEGRNGELRQDGIRPSERVYADRLGWMAPFAFDLPLDTLATAEDRLEIGNGDSPRVFHIGAVIRAGSYAVHATAICEERSH